MGCQSANKKFQDKLINLSNQSEKETRYLIEQIIINTNFNEKDIYYLFIKFCKLEPNSLFKISTTQLMELPEFKYCPFKNHLLRVFKLEDDRSRAPNLDDKSNEESQLKDAKDIESDNDSSVNSTPEQHSDYPPSSDETKRKSLNFNNFISQSDKARKKSYIIMPIVVGKQTIDFIKFCDVMKVFNSKCEVDVKIKCKFIYNFKISCVVYFDLYDFDGDGKISKDDLRNFLRVLNTDDEMDKHKVEKIGDSRNDDYESYIESMTNTIFSEVLMKNTDDPDDCMKFSEFRTLMWDTDINTACVVYLEHE